MAEKTNIGQNIKAILDILEWSQTDLASKIGVTQPTISKWLDDEIDEEKLQKIATALAMPVEFIKKFRPLKSKNEFNQTNHNQQGKNIGINSIETYNDGNVDEFIILEKEKQILLIKGHIGQFKILMKMANTDVERKEIEEQINSNLAEIEQLKEDITRYKSKKEA